MTTIHSAQDSRLVLDNIVFHNIAELRETADGGYLLQRVPESVRTHLNEGARARMRIPSAAELRFESADERVRITLSCPDGETNAFPCWGPFQAKEPVTIGRTPETIELTYPDRLGTIGPAPFEDQPFSPLVWRLRLGYDAPGPVRYHDVDGDIQPPQDAHLPNRTLLAYGTSITDGGAATWDHLAYAPQTAWRLGVNLRNLGSGGSALCEAAIADYMAGLEWDVAVLSLSVNMLASGFTVETFRERTLYMLETVADAHPDDLVVAVTLFPLFADLDASMALNHWVATPGEYRDALQAMTANLDRTNLHLVDGPELLADVGGLTPDLIHPSDYGMTQIGERLARVLDLLLAR